MEDVSKLLRLEMEQCAILIYQVAAPIQRTNCMTIKGFIK